MDIAAPIAIALIVMSLAVVTLAGILIGTYMERYRWNGLIARGVLPAPRKARK